MGRDRHSVIRLVFSVIEAIQFLKNENRSVLIFFKEPSISVFCYFDSIPVLTDLTVFFSKGQDNKKMSMFQNKFWNYLHFR